MPAGDRTGPMGMGPMTGRGAGYCAGYGVPGYANLGPGRGFWGRGGRPCWGGWGRGWRHWYCATGLPRWARRGYPPAWWGPPAPPTREEEVEMLRQEAEWLRGQLEAVSQRLSDLEKKGETDLSGG